MRSETIGFFGPVINDLFVCTVWLGVNGNLLPPKRLTGTVGVAKKTRAVTGKVLEEKRDVNKMKTIGVRISHQKQIGRSSKFDVP